MVAACVTLAVAGVCGAVPAGGEDGVELRRVVQTRGLAWVPVGPEVVEARRGSRSTRFSLGSREVFHEGGRLWLGEPARLEGGRWAVAPADAESILVPLWEPVPGPLARRPRRVVVDAGHGGNDSGARSGPPRELMEKDLALDVALRLAELLPSLGFEVVLTRSEDVFVPLPRRPEVAAEAGGDVFVSVHFNAAPRAEVRGTETYVMTPAGLRSTGDPAPEPPASGALDPVPGNAFDRENAVLGWGVQRRLLRDLGGEDRGLKRARFAVLRTLEMPGVLVEAAYLSSPEEAARVADPLYRQALASSLAAALLDYRSAFDR